VQPATWTRRLAEFNEEQHIQSLEPYGIDGEEIHRDNAVGLRTEELSPRRPAPNCWAESLGTEDLLDGGCRDRDVQALQLADDALIAPPRILAGKSHNQSSNVRRDRWSTGRSPIGPAFGYQEPVPTEEGRGRDHQRRTADARQQPACGGQEYPVGGPKRRPTDLAAQYG